MLSFLNMNAQDIHVIGYLPYYKFGQVDNIDLSKITQLNIAFANPKPNGDLYLPSGDVDAIVQKAKAQDLVCFISLGGGLIADWKAAYKNLMTKENTPAFCQKIKDYCLDHGFEGVDMDLEWSNVTNLYSDFVITLNDTLDVYGLGLTAAFPGSTRYSNVSDKALRVFDVINMMVYDYKGPWDPSNPGQHSPYGKAVDAINLWTSQGMPLSKLTLGVPFYGYDFTNQSNVKSFTFWSIVQDNPENATKNQVGQKYYNGIPMIKAKTKLAIDRNLLGVMIWELGQDAFESEDQYSLLSAINEVLTVDNEDLIIEKDNLLVYPNPTRDQIHFESSLTYSDDVLFSIYNINGQSVFQKKQNFNFPIDIDVNGFTTGLYFYRISSEFGITSGLINKIE